MSKETGRTAGKAEKTSTRLPVEIFVPHTELTYGSLTPCLVDLTIRNQAKAIFNDTQINPDSSLARCLGKRSHRRLLDLLENAYEIVTDPSATVDPANPLERLRQKGGESSREIMRARVMEGKAEIFRNAEKIVLLSVRLKRQGITFVEVQTNTQRQMLDLKNPYFPLLAFSIALNQVASCGGRSSNAPYKGKADHFARES